MTLSHYAICCALLLCFMYIVINNINGKKQKKATTKPTIKPIEIFKGENGISLDKIKERYKIEK